MKQFLLTLGSNSTLELVFDILDTSIAERWAEEIAKNYPLNETERFKNFPNNGKDTEFFIKKLQDRVDIVNNYKPNTISHKVAVDQEILNYLHRFFENLRGHIEQGTEFFNSAPSHVQNAIEEFNVYIHELESHYNNKDNPEIICTYKNRPRIELLEEDYNQFKVKSEFGTVYINYCEVGKTLIDVFKDQDQHISRSNIRPLNHYSADFIVRFYKEKPDEFYEQGLKKFYEWYNKQNFNFKHLSLGYIPVAKLNLQESKLEGQTVDEIINLVSRFSNIQKTAIINRV